MLIIGEQSLAGLFVGEMGVKTACVGEQTLYERAGGYVYLELESEKEMEEWQATLT